MAAIEVHHPTDSYADYYYASYYDNDLMWFVLGKMFSDSAHFNIIDSYSSHYQTNKGAAPGAETYAAYRWKGDPFADDDDGSKAYPVGSGQTGHPPWETRNDLGEDNDWFVIECQTEHAALAGLGYTSLPKWQAKIQWVTRYNYIADVSDPSGALYPKNHGLQYNQVIRCAPYGGWDLADATPDFNPASPPASGHVSTQNHKFIMTGGYPVIVFADGCAMFMERNFSGSLRGTPFVIGDIIPPSAAHMPMPRAFLMNGNGNDTADPAGIAGLMQEDGTFSNGSYNYATTEWGSGINGGVAFWDENQNLVESAFMSARQRSLFRKLGNRHATAAEIDTVPLHIIPLKNEGFRFSLGYIRKGYGRGTMPIQSKELLTTKDGYSLIYPWDGSSMWMR